MELIQRGEIVKGIWGGLSTIQLKRALENPLLIPKMRGQRSRAKNPPTFIIPSIPEPFDDGDDVTMSDRNSPNNHHRNTNITAISDQMRISDELGGFSTGFG